MIILSTGIGRLSYKATVVAPYLCKGGSGVGLGVAKDEPSDPTYRLALLLLLHPHPQKRLSPQGKVAALYLKATVCPTPEARPNPTPLPPLQRLRGVDE